MSATCSHFWVHSSCPLSFSTTGRGDTGVPLLIDRWTAQNFSPSAGYICWQEFTPLTGWGFAPENKWNSFGLHACATCLIWTLDSIPLPHGPWLVLVTLYIIVPLSLCNASSDCRGIHAIDATLILNITHFKPTNFVCCHHSTYLV